MRTLLAGLCLLVPVAAGALPPQQSSNEPAPARVAAYSSDNCPKFVAPAGTFSVDGTPVEVVVVTAGRDRPPPPPVLTRAADQSVTKLALHLLPDGTVKSATIVESSGDAARDNVAKTCLTSVHLAAITSNGVAIEADTTATIGWPSNSILVLSQSPEFVPEAHETHGMYYPRLAILGKHQGYVVLSFLISSNGIVRNVVIAKSTGFAELDQAAVDAVSQYRYRPAVSQDGKPVDADSRIVFVWRIL